MRKKIDEFIKICYWKQKKGKGKLERIFEHKAYSSTGILSLQRSLMQRRLTAVLYESLVSTKYR